MEEVDVPQFFLCPISLDIMRDPVTVPTGITYDRDSIEKWLSNAKNGACPVTKQPISNSELTPNHTLRRLIQSWCTLNASRGIERIPTPKVPISKAQITQILNEGKSTQSQSKCLRRLRSISSQNNANKRCIEAAGAVDFLAGIISSNNRCSTSLSSEDLLDIDGLLEVKRPSDEALSILYNLQLSEEGLKTLVGKKNGEFIESLMRVMQRGSYESRAYAVMLLKSMFEVAEPIQVITLRQEIFIEVVQLLHDQISPQASKDALKLLAQIIPWSRNRIKAVEAGLIPVLVGLLLDCSLDSRRVNELSLMLLEMMCHCAEGRAELLKHGAGLAVVSKKILRVSQVASERAVRILLSISKYSATPAILQEMLQLGVVAKLCLVLQVECGNKTKEKAKAILKLHARAWKNSSCIPMSLLSSYPS
ncbi:E3 ubiquitin-protein ligase PUB22-like [Punica granatum]|uniref:U-box domain-containing protein n=2 Tax=Punica granatum TaxID=22663 RepID=A0A218X2S2_PUNGR|nr:E3 ubiquitin-protein ligase PUB22-like [Punica granatum]OWM79029.1 hypothetical protein CDL15_Pgr003200 [Punica granatum]PKI42971.1 hypothetical protein CRG98_036769 [Punica granatum]